MVQHKLNFDGVSIWI